MLKKRRQCPTCGNVYSQEYICACTKPNNAEKNDTDTDTEIIESRRSEQVERLFRYIDINELISYFGTGDTFEDRISSGVSSPELLQVLNFAYINLTDSEKQDVLKKCEKTTASKKRIEALAEQSSRDALGNPGHYKEYTPFIINPTTRGFSANYSASNYGNTRFLLEIDIMNEVTVGDLPGEQKYVTGEPSYVSTQPILVYDYHLENDEQHDIFAMTGKGYLLTEKEHHILNLIRAETDIEECLKLVRSISESSKPATKRAILRTISQFAVNNMSLTEEQYDSFYDQLHKILSD